MSRLGVPFPTPYTMAVSIALNSSFVTPQMPQTRRQTKEVGPRGGRRRTPSVRLVQPGEVAQRQLQGDGRKANAKHKRHRGSSSASTSATKASTTATKASTQASASLASASPAPKRGRTGDKVGMRENSGLSDSESDDSFEAAERAQEQERRDNMAVVAGVVAPATSMRPRSRLDAARRATDEAPAEVSLDAWEDEVPPLTVPVTVVVFLPKPSTDGHDLNVSQLHRCQVDVSLLTADDDGGDDPVPRFELFSKRLLRVVRQEVQYFEPEERPQDAILDTDSACLWFAEKTARAQFRPHQFTRMHAGSFSRLVRELGSYEGDLAARLSACMAFAVTAKVAASSAPPGSSPRSTTPSDSSSSSSASSSVRTSSGYFICLREGIDEVPAPSRRGMTARPVRESHTTAFQVLRVAESDAVACDTPEKAERLLMATLCAAETGGNTTAALTQRWMVPASLHIFTDGNKKTVEEVRYGSQVTFMPPHRSIAMALPSGETEIRVLCLAVGSRQHERAGDIIVNGVRVLDQKPAGKGKTDEALDEAIIYAKLRTHCDELTASGVYGVFEHQHVEMWAKGIVNPACTSLDKSFRTMPLFGPPPAGAAADPPDAVRFFAAKPPEQLGQRGERQERLTDQATHNAEHGEKKLLAPKGGAAKQPMVQTTAIQPTARLANMTLLQLVQEARRCDVQHSVDLMTVVDEQAAKTELFAVLDHHRHEQEVAARRKAAVAASTADRCVASAGQSHPPPPAARKKVCTLEDLVSRLAEEDDAFTTELDLLDLDEPDFLALLKENPEHCSIGGRQKMLKEYRWHRQEREITNYYMHFNGGYKEGIGRITLEQWTKTRDAAQVENGPPENCTAKETNLYEYHLQQRELQREEEAAAVVAADGMQEQDGSTGVQEQNGTIPEGSMPMATTSM